VIPRYDPPRLVDPFGAALPASAGRRTVAVAAIARPERFFAALREEGWDVARELVFRDHHWFTSRDLESIRRAAVDAKADLVLTTEKDAMRLDRARATSEPPWAFLPMQVGIEPPSFASWINDRLGAARRDGPPQRTVEPALAGRVAARPDLGEGGEAA
jgi:tetraacyldisaccharide 4'-kinase